MTPAEWFAFANLVLAVGIIVGGYIGVRSAIAKSEVAVQARVREALHDENELLQSRVTRLEKENRRLSRIVQLIAATLKRTHGIELEVDEEVVHLRTSSGTHTVHIDDAGS